MKKNITLFSLIIGFALSTVAATDRVETPMQMEFAQKLVTVFGGEDLTLSEAELVRVISFLQENLPERTQPTGLANRLSRENNFWNAPLSQMHEDRMAIREQKPERIVSTFIEKYDLDSDSNVCQNELSIVLENIIGLPKTGARGNNVAQN